MSIDLGKTPTPGKPPPGPNARRGRAAIRRPRRSAAAGERGDWRGTASALGVVSIVAYGVAEYSYGVLIDPIHAHTGWSTPTLGAIFSAVLLIGGAGGLAGGRLVDRLGTRPAFLLAGTVGAGAVALASYQTSLLLFAALYAGGCGVIAALGYYHVTQPAAIRASSDGPGRALVWLTIFGAFASPIFLPLTAALVRTLEWRATIRVLAAIAAGVFVAAALLANSPKPRAGPGAARKESVVDALRGASGFRRWVLVSLISGVAIDVILVYQVPVMIAAGLPMGAAATVGGLRGFSQLGGRVPLSPVMRRLGARRTIVASLIAGSGGTVLLLAGGSLGPAIAYSLLAGASIGAISTLQGIYTDELVGREHLSLIMGAQQAIFGAGGAIGPVLAGSLYAATNSYAAVVLLTAAMLLMSAVILGRADRTPSRPTSASAETCCCPSL